MSSWFRPVEQLVLSSTRNRRVIGITAPHMLAGVSTVANAYAEISARWGARTLLIDLSRAAPKSSNEPSWAPGVGDPRRFIKASELSFDLLDADPVAARLGALGSVHHFRQSLAEDFDEYGAIVVDLPPILDSRPDSINPLVSALTCDGVIIVCVEGITTQDQLKQSVEAIRVAGGSVIGTALNNFGRARRRIWRDKRP